MTQTVCMWNIHLGPSHCPCRAWRQELTQKRSSPGLYSQSHVSSADDQSHQCVQGMKDKSVRHDKTYNEDSDSTACQRVKDRAKKEGSNGLEKKRHTRLWALSPALQEKSHRVIPFQSSEFPKLSWNSLCSLKPAILLP